MNTDKPGDKDSRYEAVVSAAIFAGEEYDSQEVDKEALKKFRLAHKTISDIMRADYLASDIAHETARAASAVISRDLLLAAADACRNAELAADEAYEAACEELRKANPNLEHFSTLIAAENVRLKEENDDHMRRRVIDARRIFNLKNEIKAGAKEQQKWEDLFKYERSLNKNGESSDGTL